MPSKKSSDFGLANYQQVTRGTGLGNIGPLPGERVITRRRRSKAHPANRAGGNAELLSARQSDRRRAIGHDVFDRRQPRFVGQLDVQRGRALGTRRCIETSDGRQRLDGKRDRTLFGFQHGLLGIQRNQPATGHATIEGRGFEFRRRPSSATPVKIVHVNKTICSLSCTYLSGASLPSLASLRKYCSIMSR